MALNLSPNWSWATQTRLQADDLMNPEKLLTYRDQASKKDRVMSDKMYQHAIEATQTDWASAAKYFAESVLTYPNSKALAKMAESRLKMLAKKEINIKLMALTQVTKYLNSALVLNTVDQMLNKEQKAIEQDKICIEQYLASATPSSLSDCRPLDWINLH